MYLIVLVPLFKHLNNKYFLSVLDISVKYTDIMVQRVGATWFRRGQVWYGLHAEVPITLVKRSGTNLFADYNYALAA